MDWRETFELGPDADMAALKRAYSRALKANRPDDDAVAFQRIQSAFETGLAQLRRQQAGLAVPQPTWESDAWEEEADEADEAETPLDEQDVALPWEAAPRAFEFPTTALPPEAWTQESDDVAALLDELFELASGAPAGEVKAWLDGQDSLYSLAHKREVADRLLHRAAFYDESMPWQVADVLFRFFEIDGVSDVRLRENYAARELWHRVRADERFEQAKKKLRSQNYANFTDRLVDRELYGAPGAAKRRRQMFWIPSAGKQLRRRYEELQAIDPVRAEKAFAPGVLEYWLPVTDPMRLHWRRSLPPMLLVAAGCAMAALVLLAMSSSLTLRSYFELWGIFCVVGMGIWWAGTLFVLTARNYWRWRNEHFGEGPTPVGSPVLADGYATFWICTDLALLLLAASFELFGWPYWPLTLVCAVYFFAWLGRVQLGSHHRWEELGFMLATMALALPWMGRVLGADMTQSVVLASSALASIASVFVDHWHARLRRLSITEVRESISWPLCVATLAIAALALWQYA